VQIKKPEAPDDLTRSLPRGLAWAPVVWRFVARAWQGRRDKQAFANRLEFVPQYAVLHVQEPDIGELRLQLFAINFSGEAREIDRAEIYSVQVGMRGLRHRSDNHQAHYGLPPHSLTFIALDLPLQPADIRAVLDGIPAGPNGKSMPHVDVRLHATLVVFEGKSRFRQSFEVSMPLARSSVSGVINSGSQ
jgi:hypothetical protein